MSVRSFLDSNLLVYTDDRDAKSKRDRALDLIATLRRRRLAVVSTQVIQEYFVAATRKLGVEAATARRKVELFARFELVQVDAGMIVAAIDLHRLHALSFWDALIVQSAVASGCSVLFSEDLQAGRKLLGLEIVNPFA